MIRNFFQAKVKFTQQHLGPKKTELRIFGVRINEHMKTKSSQRLVSVVSICQSFRDDVV